MDKYYCEDCCSAFYEPEEVDTGHFEDGVDDCGRLDWCPGTKEVCPFCDSENIIELMPIATIDNALSYGETNKEEIEINGFLGVAFTTAEIEKILKEHLDVSCKTIKNKALAYLLDEGISEDFAMWVVEQKRV